MGKSPKWTFKVRFRPKAYGWKGTALASKRLKEAGHLDIAMDCAADLTAESTTLIRAARDFAESQPEFATRVSLCAIGHLLAGRGYEPTPLDILNAHQHLVKAAAKCGLSDWADRMVAEIMARGAAPGAEGLLNALAARVQRGR